MKKSNKGSKKRKITLFSAKNSIPHNMSSRLSPSGSMLIEGGMTENTLRGFLNTS